MRTQFINASSLVSRLIEANQNEIEQEKIAVQNEASELQRQEDAIARARVAFDNKRRAYIDKAAAFNHLRQAAELMQANGKNGTNVSSVPADADQLISEVCNILGIDKQTIRAAVLVG